MSDDNEIEANVGEEVEIDVEEAMEAAAEDAGYGVIGEAVGIRLTCNPDTDLIAYLTDDQKGKRYILQNVAEIKYKKVEDGDNAGAYTIVFVPFAPSSEEGIIFVPYNQIGYVFQPKTDLVHEYRTKFRHSENAVSRPMPKFEG